MKRKILLCLVSSLLLAGCGQTSESNSSVISEENPSPSFDNNSSSSDIVEEKNYYATINSYNDVIYLYGLVGETFDLSNINTSRCFEGMPTFKTSGSGVEINGNILTYKEKGLYKVDAMKDGLVQYALQISVNETEEERYSYPLSLNLSSFTQHSGKTGYVTTTEDSLTLQSDSSPWTRITYDLNPFYSKNYTIECDVTFKNTTDNSRWFGLVFRDQESKNKKYPYYQFDFRQNTKLNNAVELTYVYSDGGYSYPYSGSWGSSNPGTLSSNDKVHMKISLKDTKASCSLTTGEYSTSFDVDLPNATNGNFGFQCSGSTVLIENIKLSLDETTRISSFVNEEDSIVNITDVGVDGLKPHMIASGAYAEELYGVGIDTQQFFAKVDGFDLYSINDIKMDVTINDIFLEFSGLYIPNLQVEDKKSLQSVLEVCQSFGIVDLVIWSTNTKILNEAKKAMPYARLGYIPTNVSSFETYDEIGEICREAGRNYANLILMDHELLNKENVIKATSLGYTIVANAKNGENFSVIESALDGCKLILVNYSPDVLKQTNTLYDDEIFNVEEKSSSFASQTHSLLAIPYATGHRGSGNTGVNPDTNLPENTIESFKWAYDHGTQAVEIDIHTTKDGQLAVIHNGSTEAYSNKKLTVSTSTMDQLRSIQLYGKGNILTNYHIPSLEELFDSLNNDGKYNEKAMVVEVKDGLTSTGIKAIELAKEKGWYNRITIITFSEKVAKELREYDPGIQVSYLNTVYRRDNAEFWASVNSYLSQGIGLGSQHSTVSTEALQESNARGYMYWLWTFNNTDSTSIAQHIIDGNRAYTTNYMSFFTNNKYKLIANDNISLENNATTTLSATSVTYSGETNLENDIEIIVLSDNATAKGNSITRTASGDIYAVIKYKTTWTLNNVLTDFYIYSDLIVIK